MGAETGEGLRRGHPIRAVFKEPLNQSPAPRREMTMRADDKGFDLVIPEGISVSGRIVCTEPKGETTAD